MENKELDNYTKNCLEDSISNEINSLNLNEFKNNYSVFLNGSTDLYNLNIVDYESFSLKERNPNLFFSPPSLTDDDFSKINTFFKNHGKAIFFIDQFIEKSLQINHYDTYDISQKNISIDQENDYTQFKSNNGKDKSMYN